MCCNRASHIDTRRLGQPVTRGVATGGISVYIPPKSVYLKFFMWLFCLIDPFIPTQIKFLVTPLPVTPTPPRLRLSNSSHFLESHRPNCGRVGGGSCPQLPPPCDANANINRYSTNSFTIAKLAATLKTLTHPKRAVKCSQL